jgi:hypothetical protein
MHKASVLVPDLFKEVDLISWGEQSGRNGVNWRIAPPLVVETAFVVEEIEEGGIGGRSPEPEVRDFEIGPNYVRCK